MTRVRFSEPALRDLGGIEAYLMLESEFVANRVIAKLEDVCFAIGLLPHMGHPVDTEARMFVVPRLPYKITYEYHEHEDIVFILRIFHTARDI